MNNPAPEIKLFNDASKKCLSPEVLAIIDAVARALDNQEAVDAYIQVEDTYNRIIHQKRKKLESRIWEAKGRLSRYISDAEILAKDIEDNIGDHIGREGLQPLEDFSGRLAQTLAAFSQILEDNEVLFLAVEKKTAEATTIEDAYLPAYFKVLKSMERAHKKKAAGEDSDGLRSVWKNWSGGIFLFQLGSVEAMHLDELRSLQSSPPDVVMRLNQLSEAVQDKRCFEEGLLTFTEGLKKAIPATRPLVVKPKP